MVNVGEYTIHGAYGFGQKVVSITDHHKVFKRLEYIGVAKILSRSKWVNILFIKGTLLTFTLHCEPVFRQGPKNPKNNTVMTFQFLPNTKYYACHEKYITLKTYLFLADDSMTPPM